MEVEIPATAVVYLGTGALFIALAEPLIRRRITRNHWYGFRVPATLASDAVWYDANEYAARRMRQTGAAVIGAVPLALVFGLREPVFSYVMTTVLIVLTAAMIVRTFLYLRTRSQ